MWLIVWLLFIDSWLIVLFIVRCFAVRVWISLDLLFCLLIFG